QKPIQKKPWQNNHPHTRHEGSHQTNKKTGINHYKKHTVEFSNNERTPTQDTHTGHPTSGHRSSVLMLPDSGVPGSSPMMSGASTWASAPLSLLSEPDRCGLSFRCEATWP